MLQDLINTISASVAALEASFKALEDHLKSIDPTPQLTDIDTRIKALTGVVQALLPPA